ncbi:MAG: hypothetical protein SVS85_01155, partial [Candidatus Nanohaloarchaea archaeon]|nr:hypothetical protein [Candidatus Nanohaloarchaea archaeon]
MGDAPVPEANIGLVGHVDHGKCVAAEESVLINNEVLTGNELAEMAKSEEKIGEDEDGALYAVNDLHTYSINTEGEVERREADVYVEE